jgi:hypothetical protein
MTFRKKLEKLGACSESLKWVKGKTIEQAWKTCQKSEWMIWILTQTDLDLIDPLCDMVESVLDGAPEQVCLNAINLSRCRASKDRLYDAARAVSTDAGDSYLHFAAGCLVRYVATRDASQAAYTVANAVRYAIGAQFDKERKKQCNIIRKYFTISQIKEAFNKLVA